MKWAQVLLQIVVQYRVQRAVTLQPQVVDVQIMGDERTTGPLQLSEGLLDCRIRATAGIHRFHIGQLVRSLAGEGLKSPEILNLRTEICGRWGLVEHGFQGPKWGGTTIKGGE